MPLPLKQLPLFTQVTDRGEGSAPYNVRGVCCFCHNLLVETTFWSWQHLINKRNALHLKFDAQLLCWRSGSLHFLFLKVPFLNWHVLYIIWQGHFLVLPNTWVQQNVKDVQFICNKMARKSVDLLNKLNFEMVSNGTPLKFETNESSIEMTHFLKIVRLKNHYLCSLGNKF